MSIFQATGLCRQPKPDPQQHQLGCQVKIIQRVRPTKRQQKGLMTGAKREKYAVPSEEEVKA